MVVSDLRREEGESTVKAIADEGGVRLITVENQDGPEQAQRQLEYLLQIKKSAGVLGIVFDIETVEPTAIHDRSITTETGWTILLGRGLDIFQRMNGSAFDLPRSTRSTARSRASASRICESLRRSRLRYGSKKNSRGVDVRTDRRL